MDDFSDNELLSRYALTQCEEAFALLVRRHLASVFHTARRRLGDHQLSEEVAQTVFAVLARKASRLAGHPCLLGWLSQTTHYVARRACRAEVRRSAAIKAYQSSTMTGEPKDDWKPESQCLLDHALQRLSADERNLILLHYVEGHTFGEIGNLLGKTEGSSRVRAHRALRKVAKQLRKDGLTPSHTMIGSGLASLFVGKAPALMAETVSLEAITMSPKLGPVTLAKLSLHAVGPLGYSMAALALAILVTGAMLISQTMRLHELRSGFTALPEAQAGSTTLNLHRAPRPFRSALIKQMTMDPSTLTADDLVQNTLRKMFLGAPNDHSFVNLEKLEISALLKLLGDLEAHPFPSNLKPKARILWAIGKKDPKQECELALQDIDNLFSSFYRWSEKDPVAAVGWLEKQVSLGRIPENQRPVIRLAACAMVPLDRDRAFEIMRWIAVPEKGEQLACFTSALIEHGMEPIKAIGEASELLVQQSPERLFQGTLSRLGEAGRKTEARALIDHWYGNDSEKWMTAMLRLRSSVAARSGGFLKESDWVLDQLPPEQRPLAARKMAKSLAQWQSHVADWIDTFDDDELSDHARLGLIEGIVKRRESGARSHLDRIQSNILRAEATKMLEEETETLKTLDDWDLDAIQLEVDL